MFKLDKNKIIVASKYFTTTQILQLYDMGYRNFGENRTDQLLKKAEVLPKDITWHMIGHLQRNKAKSVIGKIKYLHTLDSLKLAEVLNNNLTEPLCCFIQVNLANIDHKSGVLIDNMDYFINEIRKYDKIKVIGLMAMGIANDLIKTDEIFNELKKLSIKYNLLELSIGMSDDYEIALKYEPTFIRLGSYFKNIL